MSFPLGKEPTIPRAAGRRGPSALSHMEDVDELLLVLLSISLEVLT
jgi:hypothetical protein